MLRSITPGSRGAGAPSDIETESPSTSSQYSSQSTNNRASDVFFEPAMGAPAPLVPALLNATQAAKLFQLFSGQEREHRRPAIRRSSQTGHLRRRHGPDQAFLFPSDSRRPATTTLRLPSQKAHSGTIRPYRTSRRSQFQFCRAIPPS